MTKPVTKRTFRMPVVTKADDDRCDQCEARLPASERSSAEVQLEKEES